MNKIEGGGLGATGGLRPGKSWGKWGLFLVFLLLYTWTYTYLGTILIVEQNTVRTGNAQEGYIEAVYQARAMNEARFASSGTISSRFTRNLPQFTNGLIDPLWPWLASAYAEESPDILFEKGKWLNLLLSCGILLAMGLVAAKAFSFTGAAAMILMGGFGVILERSTYFSPDALYYLVVALTWLCALSLVRQNHLWLYGVFGVLIGLAFLAKPPVWPLVLAFVLVSIVRTIAESVGFKKDQSGERESLWVNSNQLVGFAMLLTAFLLVAGPRLSFAAEEFGDPFHTYQKYFVWLDSPAEAARFRREYSDRQTLSELTLQTRPGLVKFIEEKGVSALLQRGWEGGAAELRASALGRSGWIIFYSFGVFVIVAAIHRLTMWKQNLEIWRVRGTSARWMLLFSLIGGAITLFYAGVGHAVIPGNSMTTALFLPLLLTFIWIAERYRRQLQRSHYAILVNRVYCALMALPILWIFLRIGAAVKAMAES